MSSEAPRFQKFQSLHKSSIEITIERADVTEANLFYLSRQLKTLLARQPDVHNIVVYVKDANKAVEGLLIEKGFRKQNPDYFVLVVRSIPLGECNRILEITKANKRDYSDILPAVTNLCSHYFKSSIINSLGENEKLFVKMTAERVPCAAALTSWEIHTKEVNIDYLCALVKGAGRELFEYVVEQARLSGFRTLTLLPAGDKLAAMYKEWMGKRFLEVARGPDDPIPYIESLTMTTTVPSLGGRRRKPRK